MIREIRIDLENRQIFRKLFDDFYVPLCLFAERYLGDSGLANDTVQECFIKLWQQREDFEFLHQIKSFLYTSVKNRALNELEHRKVVVNYSGELAFKEEEVFFRDQVIEEETYRLLIASIGKLPEQTRKVMLLALEGKNNKEIAAELAIADGTVHTLKKIAYKRLREELKDYVYLTVFLLF